MDLCTVQTYQLQDGPSTQPPDVLQSLNYDLRTHLRRLRGRRPIFQGHVLCFQQLKYSCYSNERNQF